MDEFISTIWHVVVDHVLDLGNIQTSGSDCSGHQDLVFTLSEVSQSFLPLSLGPVSVDAGGGHALPGQVGRQVVSRSLFLGKIFH